MNSNKPASIADIAFDTGAIAERTRIIKLLEEELTRTSGGVFDAKGVLAKLIIDIKDEEEHIYWGCYLCGHEVAKDAVECWECEQPRTFHWLNSAGEYATARQIEKHIGKNNG
jgi:hypothetical protein